MICFIIITIIWLDSMITLQIAPDDLFFLNSFVFLVLLQFKQVLMLHLFFYNSVQYLCTVLLTYTHATWSGKVYEMNLFKICSISQPCIFAKSITDFQPFVFNCDMFILPYFLLTKSHKPSFFWEFWKVDLIKLLFYNSINIKLLKYLKISVSYLIMRRYIIVLRNLRLYQMMFHTVLCPYLWKGFVETSCMPVSTCGTCESGLEVVGAAAAGLW